MKTVSKALIGTVAAGAMAVSAATPAMARDRDGIDAGDVIAGAVVLGGIAILAGAIGKDRGDYRYRDRDYRGDRYSRQGSPRAAIERCVNAAERDARRYGYSSADVTQIRDVDDTRYGWRVKGNLVVDGNRGWGRYDRGGYDRYDRRDYRSRGYDTGSFTCRIERGRVVDIDFNGIRGLR